ncbi:MAG: histidinol phosphatase [Flavobacterium sp.]|jgi:protein-tyrosine phosphatase|nr:histidinol phosphatase [Flavobacterium sp.]
MFPFLSRKPFLNDLIPSNHVDIHAHLLPGIDDGAKTIQDSIELMTGMQALGIDQFIATPHVMSSVWENTRAGIEANFESTNKQLQEANQNFSLSPAAEYLLDGTFLELLHREPLLTLKDNYVLVEMSYLSAPIQLYDIIFEIQLEGYKPVLAHPERYLFYHQNTREYHKLKQQGCLFQLNLLSVVGYYGANVAQAAETILQKGIYDFVGTDVHHQNHLKGLSQRIKTKGIENLKEAIANNQVFRK